jgi:hypothetical protein
MRTESDQQQQQQQQRHREYDRVAQESSPRVIITRSDRAPNSNCSASRKNCYVIKILKNGSN